MHCTLYRGLECEVCTVHTGECTRGVCSVQGSCLMRQEQITSHCPQSQLEGDDAQDGDHDDHGDDDHGDGQGDDDIHHR